MLSFITKASSIEQHLKLVQLLKLVSIYFIYQCYKQTVHTHFQIYSPCILQTKKRYAGYAYESRDQIKPIFDAKGIETVRRDGCLIVSETLEEVLHLIFNKKTMSEVCGCFSFILG